MNFGQAHAHAGCVKAFKIKIKIPISKTVCSKEKHSYIMILTAKPLYLWKASVLWQTLLITLTHSPHFSLAASTLSLYTLKRLVIHFSSLLQLGHGNTISGELVLWFKGKDFFPDLEQMLRRKCTFHLAFRYYSLWKSKLKTEQLS